MKILVTSTGYLGGEFSSLSPTYLVPNIHSQVEDLNNHVTHIIWAISKKDSIVFTFHVPL